MRSIAVCSAAAGRKFDSLFPIHTKNELCPAPKLDPESAADEVHQVQELPASDVSVQQGADVAAAKLATPKRKAPKCFNCGEIGHRNLVSQCPMRKGEPKKAKRRL